MLRKKENVTQAEGRDDIAREQPKEKKEASTNQARISLHGEGETKTSRMGNHGNGEGG
jgi:hypothetical protein